MTTLILANPATARAKTLVTRVMTQLGPDHTVRWTTRAQPGSAQVRQAVAEGCTSIVVVGGDGTLRQAVAAVLGTDVTLAIVPAGRANLVARNLGVSAMSDRRAIESALHGRPEPCDVGRAVLTMADGSVRVEHFLMMAGMGRDAEAIASMRGTEHWLGYFTSGLKRLRQEPVTVDLGFPGRPVERTQAWSVFLGNLPRIPGGVELFPGAGSGSRSLICAVVRARSLREWSSVAWGRVLRRPSSRGYQFAPTVEAELIPVEPTTVQLDGDVFPAVVAARFEVLPRAVRIRR